MATSATRHLEYINLAVPQMWLILLKLLSSSLVACWMPPNLRPTIKCTVLSIHAVCLDHYRNSLLLPLPIGHWSDLLSLLSSFITKAQYKFLFIIWGGFAGSIYSCIPVWHCLLVLPRNFPAPLKKKRQKLMRKYTGLGEYCSLNHQSRTLYFF